jgi:hypothetical protein
MLKLEIFILQTFQLLYEQNQRCISEGLAEATKVTQSQPRFINITWQEGTLTDGDWLPPVMYVYITLSSYTF